MRAWLSIAVSLLSGLALAIQPATQQLLDEVQMLVQQARQQKVAPSPDAELWSRAIAKGQQAAALEPQAPEVWLLLGQLYTETKWWIKAEEAWNRYIQLAGLNDPQVRRQASLVQLNLGYAAYQRGDFETALAKFQAAGELTPDDPQPYQWMGRIHLESGNTLAARQNWQKAVQLQPNATNRYFLELSQSSLNYGREAVSAFYLGYEAYSLGRRSEALGHFNRALQAAPNWLEARRWVARVQLEQGNAAAALQQWREIAASGQASDADRYQLRRAELAAQYGLQAGDAYLQGVASYQLGDKAAARTLFESAVQSAPRFAGAWYWLGRVAYEQGDYPTAERAYSQVLILEPTNAQARYWLNQARKAMGR
jgi:tetratricopeptide (TPR) repeat protein